MSNRDSALHGEGAQMLGPQVGLGEELGVDEPRWEFASREARGVGQRALHLPRRRQYAV